MIIGLVGYLRSGDIGFKLELVFSAKVREVLCEVGVGSADYPRSGDLGLASQLSYVLD